MKQARSLKMEIISAQELRDGIQTNGNGQKVIDLSGKQLLEVPQAVLEVLVDVEVLELQRNMLTGVPSSISILKHLTEVNLKNNNLKHLPEVIGELQHLTCLCLEGNQLTVLPTGISHLKNLQRLNIAYNQFQKLPPAVFCLDSLVQLNAEENQLTELPNNIKLLRQLQVLNLSGNKLEEVPFDLKYLEKLTHLHLNSNRFSVFPSSIKYLEKLQALLLADNRLKEVPDDIINLQELTTLDVSYNKLQAITTSIGNLKNLRSLRLHCNKLKEVPERMMYLENVVNLTLHDNELLQLPANIKQMKSLVDLHVGNNQLTKVPEAIGDLTNLERLDVSWNQLSALPSSIKYLRKLEELRLEQNHFHEIPKDIRNLECLHTLSVSGNPLTGESLAFLMKIMEEGLEVVDVEIPPEILARGAEAKRAYDKALRVGSVNVYRARIFLIGQDRAGKTSLKKSLLGLPFNPNEQSTVGIEVDPSKCEIEVAHIKNWHITDEKCGLSKCSDVLLRMVGEELVRPYMYEEMEDGSDTSDEEETLEKDMYLEPEGENNVILNQAGQIGENGKESKVSLPDDAQDKAEQEVTCNDPDDSCGETPLEEPHLIASTSLLDDVEEHVTKFLREGQSLPDDHSTTEWSISLWDFAGQQVYYASHPVFFSRQAIYILVYNLSKGLNAKASPCARQGDEEIRMENPNDETNMENLLSWLSTVHSTTLPPATVKEDATDNRHYLRPPVIIVGTHADIPHDNLNIKEMEKQIQKKLSKLEYAKHVIRPFFSIDNTKSPLPDDRVLALQNKILEVLKQEPYMGKKIPIRWFHFEKVVDLLVAKKIYFIKLEDLQTIVMKACLIEEEEEVVHMLNFYHDLGVIVKHLGTVILNVQWLIDLFKQLITVPQFNDTQEPVYSDCWKELEETGILSMKLVDHVFHNFIQQGLVKEDILKMMVQFGLIAKYSTSQNEVKYFVPAQLKSSPRGLTEMKPSPSGPCPLFIRFVSGFVPHGLFQQIITKCIDWSSINGPMHPRIDLYQNGARFALGDTGIHELVLNCKKRFIKVILREKHSSSEASSIKLEELAEQVRAFLEETLRDLSLELPSLSYLQYEFNVACVHCLEANEKCTNHNIESCFEEDCLCLVKMLAPEEHHTSCSKCFCEKMHQDKGHKKWFSVRTTQVSSSCLVSSSNEENVLCDPTSKALNVTLLASEWRSCRGGLSTVNRELAVHLTKFPEVKVTLLVPQDSCSEEDKKDANSQNITINEAERRPGYEDPLDWLSSPPKDLVIDLVVGHSAKLGKQAQFIKESHSCKWLHVVHSSPEEISMHKGYKTPIAKGERKMEAEIELCKLADRVVAIGPKLRDAFSSHLRPFKQPQSIIEITPGVFTAFSDIEQAAEDGDTFKVLTFGRGDDEDFELKGYDIAAKAVSELNSSYRLIFVGAPAGEQDAVTARLLQCGISKDQLIVRTFVQSVEKLKDLFCEVDLVLMPSRSEGFGLASLEALSAGLPFLVSGNTGFAKVLQTMHCGKSYVVESEDPKEWTKAIKALRKKNRVQRLGEIQTLRTHYKEKYNWEKQSETLLNEMLALVHGSSRKRRSEENSSLGQSEESSKRSKTSNLLEVGR